MIRRVAVTALAGAIALGLLGCGLQPNGLQHRAPASLSALDHKPGQLELLVYPGAGLDPILGALRSAKRSIRMQMYMLTLDPVIDELIKAAGRGVEVQVILEANPFNPGNPSSPLPTNRLAARKLQGSGVQVGWADPRFNFTHTKMILIDDAMALVLSLNLTKSAMESREFILRDTAPSDVRELKKVFQSDWTHVPYTPKDPDLVISPTNSRDQIYNVIKSAKNEVLIGVEVAVDPQTDALIAQKVQEGVKVRALLAHPKKIGINLETGKKWKAAGATVRFQSKPFLHAKYLLADGKVGYMGSVNLTTNSMDGNREVGVVVKDKTILGRFGSVFESDWAPAEPLE